MKARWRARQYKMYKMCFACTVNMRKAGDPAQQLGQARRRHLARLPASPLPRAPLLAGPALGAIPSELPARVVADHGGG